MNSIAFSLGGPLVNRRQALSLVAWTPSLSLAILAQEKYGTGSFSRTRAFLQKFIDEGQANGAIACVWRRGRIEFEAVDGWMDSDHSIQMRRDAIFNIASLSKPITGVSAMILIEQGRIHLEDPIGRWIPELADRRVLRRPDGPLDDTYPAPRQITVADLLSMHMGLGAYGPPGPLIDAQEKIPIASASDPDTWLRQLGELPLQYPPGECWLNDTSVDVLGLLICRATGGSLYAFQQEHILSPLGMKDTDFFVPSGKLERAARFPPEGAKPLQTAPPKVESGGDGMYSSMWDYLQFARMLRNNGELDGKRILKPASIAAMTSDKMRPDEHQHSPYADRYPGRGFGYTLSVRTEPLAGGPSVGAFNWNGTTGVWFLVDPPRDMIVLLMVQHPTAGKNARTGVAYISKIQENNLFQSAVYADL